MTKDGLDELRGRLTRLQVDLSRVTSKVKEFEINDSKQAKVVERGLSEVKHELTSLRYEIARLCSMIEIRERE